MEEKHARCAGLDVHRKLIVACVRLAEGGKVKRDVRRFGTATAKLCELADWLEENGCTHAVMESTGVFWKPVWHILEGHVELVLANAQQVRNLPGRKSDMNDATWLAELMAHGLVRGSFVPPEPIRELRDQTRTRAQLVSEVRRHQQRISKRVAGCQPPDHGARLQLARPHRAGGTECAGRGSDRSRTPGRPVQAAQGAARRAGGGTARPCHRAPPQDDCDAPTPHRWAASRRGGR